MVDQEIYKAVFRALNIAATPAWQSGAGEELCEALLQMYMQVAVSELGHEVAIEGLRNTCDKLLEESEETRH